MDLRNGSSLQSSTAYLINLENFMKRLKLFYSHWANHNADHWCSSDALVIATPPASDDIRYLKSSALNLWLLGLEFPETIMVFMNKQIHFLCTRKKATFLQVLKRPTKETVGADIIMHVKGSDDGTALMDELLLTVRSQLISSGHDSPVIGYLARETPEENFTKTWAGKLNNSNLQLADVTNGFSELLALKDHTELVNVMKAAFLTSSVMTNHVLPKLKTTIAGQNNVSHAALKDDTEECIIDPARVKVKLKAENADICYPPIFQSGGEFDLRPSASSNDENLYYDSTGVIICAIGSRYNSYCANLARTFLIDPNAVQSKAYETLLKAQEAAISALKPGNQASAAYLAACEVVKKEAPDFLPNLTKSAGTGIGLEFRESGLSLNGRNERALKAGMVFNVSLGFQNLQSQTNNPKTETCFLFLADTVIVKEEGPPNVATAFCTKAVKDVVINGVFISKTQGI